MQSLVEAPRDWRWQHRTPREMNSPRTTEATCAAPICEVLTPCRGSASSKYEEQQRDFVRVVSACTLGLWSFAAGLLIGTFILF